ncbi:P-type DNA transfer ATPase VirB11 [Emcibacter nanhaiensis]|uniref:Type IV secretion system protein n=1 Tax=Emcibacter nanhaiensis TaxID=1505037 RepID=A0A501PJZ9_9PROT|nr:P-type DNA transfer ATPase VirB11 [Emcibacter nanhaiensis]TPD60224.1 P-type DNA transfer ATPase VirB11 [Emcibacter nanhaiensis]
MTSRHSEIVEITPGSTSGGFYLQRFLAPFQPWLKRRDISEILVNRPEEIWIEVRGKPQMERLKVPEVTTPLLARLAGQIARYSRQGVNNASPLLSAILPDGSRVQMVAPAATRGHWGLAIRRHTATDLTLDAYRHRPSENPEMISLSEDSPMDLLIQAVHQRKTVLISGGTSSGKTTFLNALLKEVPASERIIAVEDTPEIFLGHENALGLVAVHGPAGEDRVSLDDLLKASLRLRPDRIIVGEVRGPEAVTFLRAVNTGHPGSLTTIHANSPQGALEQMAMMVMQAQLGLGWDETLRYISSLVDVVVQLGRSGGQRYISEIILTR